MKNIRISFPLNSDDLVSLTTKSGGRFSSSNLNQAYRLCKRIALRHYENFPVASILIPRKLRKHIYAVYAYARIADDIADEPNGLSIESRLEALNNMNELLKYSDDITNPIFMAVHSTISNCGIPKAPFEKLLIAFKADVRFKQAEDWNDTLYYCRNSANPVGELILRIYGNYSREASVLSDFICSALQLVNFWQDLSIDLRNERHYIPKKKLSEFNLTGNDMNNADSISIDLCLKDIYDFTEKFFIIGKDLLGYLESYRLKREIAFTIEGGLTILNKIRKSGNNIIFNKPKLSLYDFIKAFTRSVLKY